MLKIYLADMALLKYGYTHNALLQIILYQYLILKKPLTSSLAWSIFVKLLS